MRKIKLYIAMSLNGMIAKTDGDIQWLETFPNPDKNDYGYGDFYKSIDTTIQGYKTYEILLNRGIEIPSKDKINYVLTKKQDIPDLQYIQFIKSDHLDFIKDLKTKEGLDIWLIGGGQINTLLFNEDLIDEIRVFVMPIVIETGIKLFELVPKDKMLHLMDTSVYKSGVVELIYTTNN